MQLKFALTTILVCFLVLEATEARRVMKGGKPGVHHRSKRTIGDIINWKLGLLQNIFDGITGIFGGGSSSSGSSYGAPSSSYGAPAAPSYRPSRKNNHLLRQYL